jgi:hypothetical protein
MRVNIIIKIFFAQKTRGLKFHLRKEVRYRLKQHLDNTFAVDPMNKLVLLTVHSFNYYINQKFI